MSANPPPYDDPEALAQYVEGPIVEPAQRHLQNFLVDVRTQAPVPTLRSFLKLYASLDTSKLASFLDVDEEEMVQQMMVMKQASRSISRIGSEKGHLEGQTISSSDLDFVIDEVSSTHQLTSGSLNINLRIWSISLSPLSEGVMLVGSFGTLSMHREFSTHSNTRLCLLRQNVIQHKFHSLLQLNPKRLHGVDLKLLDNKKLGRRCRCCRCLRRLTQDNSGY